MKKILIIALVLSLAIVGLSARYGYGHQGSGYGYGSHRGGYGYRGSIVGIVYSLGLTTEQNTSLDNILQARRDRHIATRDDRLSARYKAYANNSFSRSIFVENIIANATKEANQKADEIEDILNILTDDQKKAFFSKMEELKTGL